MQELSLQVKAMNIQYICGSSQQFPLRKQRMGTRWVIYFEPNSAPTRYTAWRRNRDRNPERSTQAISKFILFTEEKAGYGPTFTLVFTKVEKPSEERYADPLTLYSQGTQLWRDDFQKWNSDNATANDSDTEETRLHRMSTVEWHKHLRTMSGRLKPEGAKEDDTRSLRRCIIRAADREEMDPPRKYWLYDRGQFS